MYITDANQAFRCFHNPYCVRPEDYVKPSNESLVVHVPPEREAERGTLPAWRIFGLSFVSEWASHAVLPAVPTAC